MIFSSTCKTIKGELSAISYSGIIGNTEPEFHPFKCEDSEYHVNRARSWLESYDSSGYNNHLLIDCLYIQSVEYEDTGTEYYHLLSFEGRKKPESCVIMKSRYDASVDAFEIDYFALIAKNAYTERRIDETEFSSALRTYFFGETEIASTSFYEFTQHPDFLESVATYTLLNY